MSRTGSAPRRLRPPEPRTCHAGSATQHPGVQGVDIWSPVSKLRSYIWHCPGGIDIYKRIRAAPPGKLRAPRCTKPPGHADSGSVVSDQPTIAE
jgi:hypothetical protein